MKRKKNQSNLSAFDQWLIQARMDMQNRIQEIFDEISPKMGEAERIHDVIGKLDEVDARVASGVALGPKVRNLKKSSLHWTQKPENRRKMMKNINAALKTKKSIRR